jgi:hypothetical protein
VSSKDASLGPPTLVALATGLVLTALGGFYFALGLHSGGLPPPAVRSTGPANTAAPPSSMMPSAEAAPPSAKAVPPVAPAPPPAATPESIEAEVALSEYSEVLAFVKKNFKAEFDELMVAAARRRNEGVSDQVFGQELAAGVQNFMRGRLRYGVGASLTAMDRLAANEASLFHALGTEAADFCLKMLGVDDKPVPGVPPEDVRRMMQLGTLYRLQAIAEGMPDEKPVAPLSKDELQAYEASVTHEGLNFNDVNSGAFLKAVAVPGKPCLTLETLHLAIARLSDPTRRKIYAGMFFLGRGR